MSIGLRIGLASHRRALLGGANAPLPDIPGYVYLVRADGTYLRRADGTYLVRAA